MKDEQVHREELFLKSSAMADVAQWILWFLYKMVAHFIMPTYGVDQAFRFVASIWLHRKSRQIGKYLFYTIRAQHVLSYHLI